MLLAGIQERTMDPRQAHSGMTYTRLVQGFSLNRNVSEQEESLLQLRIQIFKRIIGHEIKVIKI
jgi:hypothetical protein